LLLVADVGDSAVDGMPAALACGALLRSSNILGTLLGVTVSNAELSAPFSFCLVIVKYFVGIQPPFVVLEKLLVSSRKVGLNDAAEEEDGDEARSEKMDFAATTEGTRVAFDEMSCCCGCGC